MSTLTPIRGIVDFSSMVKPKNVLRTVTYVAKSEDDRDILL